MNFYATPVDKSNYKKAIIEGFDKKDFLHLFPYLAKDDYPKVHLWAMRMGFKTSWDKLKEGDIIFFYYKSSFIAYSFVMDKGYDPDLAQLIWHDIKGQPKLSYNYSWPLFILLSKPNECNIPFTTIRDLSDYSEKYHLRAFSPLNQKFKENIHNKYGSIKGFIDKESLTTSKSHPSTVINPA